MATDPIFRSYNTAQAQQYAEARLAYPLVLYEHILTEHGASGGRSGLVFDVGCGPGSATRILAPMFDHVVGLDPGQEMIEVARERGGKTKTGEDIRYEVCEAERMTDVSVLPLGGVDLICAATAVCRDLPVSCLSVYRAYSHDRCFQKNGARSLIIVCAF